MTHQSHHQTNGASLEDCHTNIYALTDLCGIKWRKLVSADRPAASSDPLDDPVLRSYSRCLAADILCVWRRVASIRNDIYDTTSVVHPPLSLTAAKELWIFWYGEEPDLTDLVVPELLKANDGTNDHGSWEGGLSYEGRGLLFKALHNLIERSLLSRDIVLRLGRWFVQPCNATDPDATAGGMGAAAGTANATSTAGSGSAFTAAAQNFVNAACAGLMAQNASAGNERVFGKSAHNLSFSFAFFVHGDSTVCASIDLREHPAIHRLSMDHLNEAILQQQSAAANQQPPPPPPPSAANPLQPPPHASKAQTPMTSPGATSGGQNNNNNNNNAHSGDSVPKARRVILAPFGMSGTLTGQVYRVGSLDAATQKALDGWCAFYPLPVAADNPDDLPIMVEVVTGGVKLRYPTKYVLVSEVDEYEGRGGGGGGVGGVNGGVEEEEDTQLASIKGAVPFRVAADPRHLNGSSSSGSISSSIKRNGVDLKQQLQQQCKSGLAEALGNDLNHPLSMHARPTVATVLPERVWQDCVVHVREAPVAVVAEKEKTALPMLSPSQIKQEPGCEAAGGQATGTASVAGGATNGVFKFNDPTAKTSCACVKANKSNSSKQHPQHPLASNLNSGANESLVPMTSCGNSPNSAEPSPRGNATGLSQQSLPSELLPITSSPCVGDQQTQQPHGPPQQQQQTTSVMEKLLNSENSTNLINCNSANSQADAKTGATAVAAQEDRLGSGEGVKGVSNSGKRKMDYGGSGSSNSSFNSNSDNYSGIASYGSGSANSAVSLAQRLLKRPTLATQDYENIVDDELEPHQLLYDYSSCDGWSNAFTKRCRVGEEATVAAKSLVSSKPVLTCRNSELYAMHQRQLQLRKEQQNKNLSSGLPSATGILLSGQSAASNSPAAAINPNGAVDGDGVLGGGGDGGGGFNALVGQRPLMDFQDESSMHDSKTGASTAEDEGGGVPGGSPGASAIGETKDLLTSKGLQPSIKDLDNLFEDNLMDDNSNDDSIQVNTPPASNNSVQGGGNCGPSGSSVTTVSVNMNSNLVSCQLGGVVLTPPSLEVSSPCGGALSDGGGGLVSSDIEMKFAATADSVAVVPQYPNLGSPLEEPIEDWSHVFLPQKRCSLVGSSMYALMTDLPSQTMPPLEYTVQQYKATWENKPKGLQQQSQTATQMKTIKPLVMQQQQQQQQNNKENINQNPMLMKGLGGPLMNIKQEPQLPGSPGMNTTPASITNPMLTAQLSRPSPLQGPMMGQGGMTPNPLMHGGPMLRGVSPMGHQFSPNPNLPPGHPMNQQFRRTPLPPPPPYELAVSSPANQGGPNFSGMMPGGAGGDMMQQMQMQRVMMNQQQQPMSQMMGGNVFPNGFAPGGMMNNVMPSMLSGSAGQLTTTSTASQSPNAAPGLSLPEADSILVNVLLYDTVLNIFRDHNFDSCTICVCNASKKCVGNIRGSESGVYLPLPGTNFTQMTQELSRKASGQSAAGMNGGMFNGNPGFDAVDGGQPNGYPDDDPVSCQCGFSAVVNRRLAHNSGLFYEDEMEITGMATDPAIYKKKSLLNFVLQELQRRGKADTNNNSTVPAIKSEFGNNNSSGGSRSNTPDATAISSSAASGGNNMLMEAMKNSCDNADSQDNLPLAIMELLRDQCLTLVHSSSSSILRAIKKFDRMTVRTTFNLNMLEFTEAHEVITLALEQARIIFESSSSAASASIKMELDPFGNPMPSSQHQMMRVNNGPLSSTSSIGSGSALMRGSFGNNSSSSQMLMSTKASASLAKNGPSFNAHKWPFVVAKGPRSNQDIIRLMKSMQPILQDAFHKACKTRLWDAPYTPLTWREFHRKASTSTGQCEPQPIPSVIVGHERDWLSLSPYALQYWDKLLLEPYSYSRDIAYVVVAPDNDFVVGKVKTFFKELSTTYEMCKLGRHTPIKGWDGVFRVGKAMKHISGVTSENSSSSSSADDDWFTTLGESKVAESLRLYYQACQSYLVPYLTKVPSDRSLLDPPESYQCPAPPGPYGSNASSAVNLLNKSLPSPMLPPNTPEPSTTEKAPNTPKSSGDSGEGDQKDLNTSGPMLEPLSTVETDDVNPPCIMIYIVEPFTCGNDSPELQRLACLSLLRCYSSILNAVPESIRANISFQIISQESVCELGRSRSQLRLSDEMRCLALSVFSQCRRFLTHVNHGKSLTGFGTAAQMELFLKQKDEKNRMPHRLYTPPYILSAKQSKAEQFGKRGREHQSSVLYCSYCLSKDQTWLLAVATDERGELLETTTINVDIPNRTRRKKASARLPGLQKLMDWMLGIISQTVQPWRIVVGRIGRIGHGELKGWSFLLSKPNLAKAAKHLKEICNQCSLLSPGSVPSILSACLIAIEPDSNLRVMPDQFTPDERFSQMSVHNPLSTPQDVSCTHILVFPLSAKAQSNQQCFNDNMDPTSIMDDVTFLPELEADEELVENVNNFNHLFSDWDDQLLQTDQNMGRSSPGSPGMDEIMVQRTSPGLPPSNGAAPKAQQDTEEIGTLSQQPLSLGYLVSTAPMGRMPDWFWSACPHMENVCPSYLKMALHLNTPSIQSIQDDIGFNNSASSDHPLDSTYTAVVLRHVMEGFNLLSWLAMDSNTHDRLSCLPIHVQLLMQLYHMSEALA